MDEELISKKELLELTDISYGQLYRWKRKGLIPEEWFIKKASFTGQETFFPKLKVLSRIEKIKNMKEDISLDELADVFTPTLAGLALRPDEIIGRGLASGDILRMYQEINGLDMGSGSTLGYSDILMLYLIGKLIIGGDIGRDEAKTLLEVLKDASASVGLEGAEVVLLRKLGVFVCFIVKPAGALVAEKSAKILARLDMAALVEELKLKLL
jgi:hypothetical protein